ncbi:MAG TPA: GNAT family N-acetyltransferase [Dehalococcoidia bacterium]|jgi:ribosomal protein S18 acetylase RimI-like enzyme|nr:GNAT family N-acetyltransferase [Dehalococcoidia bacterium]
MTEPVYRLATKRDATAVAEVGAQIWEELGAGSGLPQQPTTDGIASLIANHRGGVFVCDTGDEMCGFAALGPDPDDPDEAVMGVWLVASARRKGIGRELALMATDFARRLGYAKLRGTLPKDNEPALSFFSDIGTLATIVGQGMRYELPL